MRNHAQTLPFTKGLASAMKWTRESKQLRVVTRQSRSWSRSMLVIAFLGCTSTAVLNAADSAVVIENCSLFDSIAEKMVADQTIIIQGNRISGISGPELQVEIPKGAHRIDGRGKYALPGLIDAHVHVVHVLNYAHITGDEILPLFLAAGVTSVRSTGDEVVAAKLVARYAETHSASCPRVFTCSPLLDGDPPYHKDVGRGVADPTQVRSLFDDLTKWGIRTVKIYAGTARPVGRAIIEEAHRRGLFVTAHLGFYSAQDAVEDGVNGLEHIWSVYNYSIPPGSPTGPGARGRLDLANPKCEGLVAELARQKTFVDPTLSVHRNMILLADVPEIRDHADNALMPRRLRDFWPVYLAKNGSPSGGTLEERQAEFAKYQELTGKLYRAGVPLQIGTDAPEPNVPPGFSVHQELERFVESGIPPAAALSAATMNNAITVGEKENLGSISAGKLADLLLLTANPLDDIRNTRTIELVIRDGQISKPADLLRLVPKE